MNQPVEDLSHTVQGQGRDGGDQHPDDAVLSADHEEITAVMDGLTQDDSTLKDA